MTDITHRFVETNGIRMHLAEAGEGPLVLLLHGFPELWYSWRHQLIALAQAGYHVVAPDQRGYGQTDCPAEIEKYTQLHLVGDMIGLLDALKEEQAVVVGHDWGGLIAWDVALMRPDRVKGIVGLSAPFIPRGPISSLTAMRSRMGENFYIVYFQQPGVAEAEFERDVRTMIRMTLYSASGDSPEGMESIVPEGGLLSVWSNPQTLPSWLTEQDIDYSASHFERTGFRGALNWYRTMDRSWELMGAWNETLVHTPALFIAGERDGLTRRSSSQRLVANLKTSVPNLRGALLLPGCGHWVQQERPAEVNAALIEFLQGLE